MYDHTVLDSNTFMSPITTVVALSYYRDDILSNIIIIVMITVNFYVSVLRVSTIYNPIYSS